MDRTKVRLAHPPRVAYWDHGRDAPVFKLTPGMKADPFWWGALIAELDGSAVSHLVEIKEDLDGSSVIYLTPATASSVQQALQWFGGVFDRANQRHRATLDKVEEAEAVALQFYEGAMMGMGRPSDNSDG